MGFPSILDSPRLIRDEPGSQGIDQAKRSPDDLNLTDESDCHINDLIT